MDRLTITQQVILIVDDEPLLRLNATEALQQAGCMTYDAGEAQEALDMLEQHPEISILFTDINMPGEKDGLALAREVYQQRPDIRVIITSGQERPKRADIPHEGQFIAKPYDMDVVTEIARAFAEG